MTQLENTLADIRACTVCKDDMRETPRPIVQASASARILIAGQAPGNLARNSGRPFTDPSGVRLREWMAISDADFYDEEKCAIVPMGFCFPGYDQSGSDIAPMKRCADTWRGDLLEQLPNIEMTLLIGTYAQKWHLPDSPKTLKARMQHWQDYAAQGIYITPHPSWRNTGWLKRNPWFEADVLPVLRGAVSAALAR